jgi:hypothetical protein
MLYTVVDIDVEIQAGHIASIAPISTMLNLLTVEHFEIRNQHTFSIKTPKTVHILGDIVDTAKLLDATIDVLYELLFTDVPRTDIDVGKVKSSIWSTTKPGNMYAKINEKLTEHNFFTDPSLLIRIHLFGIHMNGDTVHSSIAFYVEYDNELKICTPTYIAHQNAETYYKQVIKQMTYMTTMHTMFREHVDTFRKSFDRFNNDTSNQTITEWIKNYNTTTRYSYNDVTKFIGSDDSLQYVLNDLSASIITIDHFNKELEFIKENPHARPGNTMLPSYISTVADTKMPSLNYIQMS